MPLPRRPRVRAVAWCHGCRIAVIVCGGHREIEKQTEDHFQLSGRRLPGHPPGETFDAHDHSLMDAPGDHLVLVARFDLQGYR
jgi:hypothetical protein